MFFRQVLFFDVDARKGSIRKRIAQQSTRDEEERASACPDGHGLAYDGKRRSTTPPESPKGTGPRVNFLHLVQEYAQSADSQGDSQGARGVSNVAAAGSQNPQHLHRCDVRVASWSPVFHTV